MSSKNDERRQPDSASADSKGGWSLARRLTVWYLCCSFAAGTVVTAFYHWGLHSGFAAVDDDLLREQIQGVGGLLSRGKPTHAELLWEIEQETAENRQLYTRILYADGRPLMQTPGMARLLPAGSFPAASSSTGRTSLVVRTPSGHAFAAMAATVAGSKPDEKWVIQVAYDRTALEAAMEEHEGMMAAVLAGVAFAALGFGYLMVRHGLRPLREMVASARRVGSSNLSERAQLQHLAPELKSLAESFNEMLDRLDTSFKHIHKFSADIAHELRTPLTNLRGEAEAALSKERSVEQYREVLLSSLEEYEHLAGTIDRLLFLALAERSEGCLEKKLVNVGEELMSIAGFYEPAASEMNLSIQVAANGDLAMKADPVLVRRAVSNLVSNAIANTPPGGTIGLAAYKQKSSIRVVVADTGVGIPAEHLPHVFDRFYRVTPAAHGRRGGSGLGLSIVQVVMNLHKGLVEITSTPGRGTCVILEFPLLAKP